MFRSLMSNRINVAAAIPLVVLLIFVAVIPFAGMLWLSFSDLNFNLPGRDGNYVGLSNYSRMLADGRLWASVGRTGVFVAVSVALQVAIGAATAFFLWKNQAALGRLMPFVVLPILLAPVTVGLLGRLLLHGDYGVVACALHSCGLLPSGTILGDPTIAVWAAVAIDTWQWTPFCTLIVLAGLRSIPQKAMVASELDGASRLGTLLRVTTPLALPSALLAIVVRTIDAFRTFDSVYVLTGGGPGNRTELLTIYIYKVAFIHGDIGYASAVTLGYFVVLLLLISVVSLTFLKVATR